jgi:hypothetical protein
MHNNLKSSEMYAQRYLQALQMAPVTSELSGIKDVAWVGV